MNGHDADSLVRSLLLGGNLLAEEWSPAEFRQRYVRRLRHCLGVLCIVALIGWRVTFGGALLGLGLRLLCGFDRFGFLALSTLEVIVGFAWHLISPETSGLER